MIILRERHTDVGHYYQVKKASQKNIVTANDGAIFRSARTLLSDCNGLDSNGLSKLNFKPVCTQSMDGVQSALNDCGSEINLIRRN
jgi:hypothetical protein